MNSTVAADTSGENHLLGILWMLLTMCLFVSMDTVVKYLTQSLPPFQIVWARFFFHMFWLALLLRGRFVSTFTTRRLPLQLARSACLVLTTCLFFSGLLTTELSTATAIMFLSPIFVTLLAIPLLGERVGLRRLSGVVVGFMGALIIVHPRSGSGFDLPAAGHLLVVGAALTNAFYQIITRHLREADSQMTTLLYSAVVGVLLMSATAPFVWQGPTPMMWVLLSVVGLFGLTSHFCLIRALKYAPASVVVPYSYTALLWATLFGYLLFDALPDTQTILGAALIVASGLYIFYRETRLQRSNG